MNSSKELLVSIFLFLCGPECIALSHPIDMHSAAFYDATNSGAMDARLIGTPTTKLVVNSSQVSRSSNPTVGAGTSADLSISKTDGIDNIGGGQSLTYLIIAGNSGPENAIGATVTDYLPPGTTCTWSCSGTGGGSCGNPTGSGNIDTLVDLPVDSSVTFSVPCVLDLFPGNPLTNTAEITPPSGVSDPNMENNLATDTDAVSNDADLSISVTENRNFVQLGDTLDYTIQVSNPVGPSSAFASMSFIWTGAAAVASWICVPTGGAICAMGGGNTLGFQDAPFLPVGGTTTYLYSVTLNGPGVDISDQVRGAGSVNGTASSDPNPSNNSVVDIDILVIFRDEFESVFGAPQ